MENERKTDKPSTCFKVVSDMPEWYFDFQIGNLPPLVFVTLTDASINEGCNGYTVGVETSKLQMRLDHEEKHNALITFFKLLQLDKLSVSQLKEMGFV
jgi:hypothetical protein